MRTARWLEVRDVTDSALRRVLRRTLDEGEADAIALCEEIKSGVVLLDEREAREAAHGLGLRVLGTVSILLWARVTNRLPSLRAALDELETKGGFRLAVAVRAAALAAAGETKSGGGVGSGG